MYGKVTESSCAVELNVGIFGVQEVDKHSHTSCLHQLLSVTLYTTVGTIWRMNIMYVCVY